MKLLFFLLWAISFFAASIHEKVMICGVCQNVAQQLPYTIKIMEEMGALFEDYQVVIYENNSTDRTIPLLQEWKKKNSRINLISENISQSEFTSQIVNRNKDGSFYRAEMI